MSKRTKKQLAEAKAKAMKIYEERDNISNYVSLNEEAAYKPWQGIYVKREKINTKRFGETTRWLFRLPEETEAHYSLLCDSETLHSVMDLVLDDDECLCEVFKNAKGEWRIIPWTE